jgi:hypothetical protein
MRSAGGPGQRIAEHLPSPTPHEEFRRGANEVRAVLRKRHEEDERAGFSGIEAARDESRIDQPIRLHQQGPRQHDLFDLARLDCRERLFHRGFVLDGERVWHQVGDRPLRLRSDVAAQGHRSDHTLGQAQDRVATPLKRQRSHDDAGSGLFFEGDLGQSSGTMHMVRTGGHVDGARGARRREAVLAVLEHDALPLAVPVEEVSLGRRGSHIRRTADSAHRRVPMSSWAAPIPNCTRRQRVNPASLSSPRSSSGAGR